MDDAQLKTTTALINGGYPLHSFEDVQSLYEVYISNQSDRDKIKKAYDFDEDYKGSILNIKINFEEAANHIIII